MKHLYAILLFLVVLQSNLSKCKLLNDLKKLFAENLLEGDELVDFVAQIKFRCFGDSVDNYTDISYSTATDDVPSACLYNVTNGTTIIFFFDGFKPNPTEPEPLTQDLMTAFLQRPEVILISLKYESLVSTRGCELKGSTITQIPCLLQAYWSSVNNATTIAWSLVEIFSSWMSTEALPMKQVRLVGYNVGVEIIFQLAERVHRTTGNKLERATGIEPPGPGYWSLKQYSYRHHLKYVDIIHGNPGVYGTAFKLGMVDIFVNYPNTFQPGCKGFMSFFKMKFNYTESKCSQDRAMELYTESVRTPNSYPACCTMFYPLPTCTVDNPPLYVGYDLKPETNGVCFLQTNSKKPYSEGLAGADVKF